MQFSMFQLESKHFGEFIKLNGPIIESRMVGCRATTSCKLWKIVPFHHYFNLLLVPFMATNAAECTIFPEN